MREALTIWHVACDHAQQVQRGIRERSSGPAAERTHQAVGADLLWQQVTTHELESCTVDTIESSTVVREPLIFAFLQRGVERTRSDQRRAPFHETREGAPQTTAADRGSAGEHDVFGNQRGALVMRLQTGGDVLWRSVPRRELACR